MKMTNIIASKIDDLFGSNKDTGKTHSESELRQEYEEKVGIIGTIVDYFACLKFERECEKHEFDGSGAGYWGCDDKKLDILKTKEDREEAGIGLRYGSKWD